MTFSNSPPKHALKREKRLTTAQMKYKKWSWLGYKNTKNWCRSPWWKELRKAFLQKEYWQILIEKIFFEKSKIYRNPSIFVVFGSLVSIEKPKLPMGQLRSYIELNVIVAWEVVVFPDEEDILPALLEVDADVLQEESFVCVFPRSTLTPMNSERSPGLEIFSLSTSISPVSIFTTVDMEGRSFDTSWVQRRPIFR